MRIIDYADSKRTNQGRQPTIAAHRDSPREHGRAQQAGIGPAATEIVDQGSHVRAATDGAFLWLCEQVADPPLQRVELLGVQS
jgi:hypothetical protein